MPPIEILIKRGTSTQLAEQNPALLTGEPCLEVDTGRVKYGDGITPWNLLSYASGEDVSFGTNNEATGTDAFAAGGSDNSASGIASASLGGINNATGGENSVVLGGDSGVAESLNASVLGGSNNLASGVSSVVPGGQGNVAQGTNSVAIGKYAKATKESQIAMSSGRFTQTGDAQSSIYHLRCETVDDTPTRMYINGTTGNLTMEPGAAWTFDIMVVAYDGSEATQTSSSSMLGMAGAWSIKGGVTRDYSNNTSLCGSPTVVSWADGWGESSGVSVSADDVSESLAITVTGDSARNIFWVARVSTSEVIAEEPLISDMFVEVAASSSISSLSVVVDGNSMQPDFDPATTDYVAYSNVGFYDATERDYSVVINGGAPISGTATVNKAIRVKFGTQDYFIRILPSDFPPLLDIQTKTSQWIPGHYLLAYYNVPYFAVHDGNGVPVWYTHADESLCQIFSLHEGWEPNRMVTCGATHNCDRWEIQIGLNEMTAKPYTMINPDTRGGYHTWEIHESKSVRGPLPRRGNIIYESYDSTGFYIQEQNPQNQIVWEWWSDDYFNTTYSDFFHLNSVDVHPVTGDIVVSCRHNSAIFAIDYETKDVIWVLQGDGCGFNSLYEARKVNVTTNTHWLTPYDEPTVSGYSQYSGTDYQHDARWNIDFLPNSPGNDIVTVFDDQSCNYRPARGVVYEIDLANDRAIFRSHSYSPNGSCPYQGGFTLLKEFDGSFSYVLCLPEQNPNLMEFSSDQNGNGTQNITLEAYTNQVHYRCIKVRPDFLNINYMRTTAGRVPTII